MTSSWSHPTNSPPAVLPLPSSFAVESGYFDVSRLRRIQIEQDTPALREVAFFLARELSERLGRYVRCLAVEDGADYTGSIGLTTATKKLFLTDEGYDLDVKSPLAFISAPRPRGLLHGAITLLQLIQPDAEGGLVLPTVRAIDKPNLAWRALRIDATRETPPMPWLSRLVEICATLRLNGFRLVLADSTLAPSDALLEPLAARCRERGIDLRIERARPSPSGRPFRIVRLTTTATADATTTTLPGEELRLSDSALPSVDEIHGLAPDKDAMADDRRCVGVEAWVDWIPGASEALLERAYLTRLAAFAEAAWTGPFRRSFSDFRERLSSFFAVLDRLGADYDVPPPCGIPEQIEFDGECALELVPPMPGAYVEYTLDGTEPTIGSPVATAPLFLSHECVLKSRTRLRNGKTSAVITTLVRRAATA